MIEELKKEYLERINKQEEEKIFNAIHEQAYWKKVEADNKRIFNNIRKTEKNNKKRVAPKVVEVATLLISITPILFMLFVLGAK